MKFKFYLLSFLLLSSTAFSQSSNKAYATKDLEALNALPAKWERYWNSHNMDSMGTMLTNDVDFVNVAGTWLKGKAVTVKDHAQKHQTMFKTSVWSTDSVAIKYVKPDLAIMHVGWGIKGDFSPEGTPRNPRHGIFTWIVIKQNEKWLLLAVHNVNMREVPVKQQ